MTRNKQSAYVLRLAASGIDPNIIPGFVRNLAKSVVIYPHMNLVKIDRKLHYLGWSGHELDSNAYQLALDDLAAASDFDGSDFPDLVFHPYFHNA